MLEEKGGMGRKVLSITENGEVDVRWLEHYETAVGPGLRPSDFGITLTVDEMASVIGADIDELFAAAAEKSKTENKTSEWDFYEIVLLPIIAQNVVTRD